jgi:hypothetical protein
MTIGAGELRMGARLEMRSAQQRDGKITVLSPGSRDRYVEGQWQ